MKVEQPFFYWFVCKSFFSTLLLYHCNDKHWLLLRCNFCIAMLKVFLFCDKVSLYCHTLAAGTIGGLGDVGNRYLYLSACTERVGDSKETNNPKYIVMLHLLVDSAFFTKIISHTINLYNFRIWEHSGNCLNVIIQNYGLSEKKHEFRTK